MIQTAFLAALCVFVCLGGNWLWGQTMIERPLIVGTITGLIMGNMQTGILIGASLEAIFMGAVDIGGALSAEPVTATVLATTFAITLGVNTKAALALAVPIGVFAAFILMFMKNVVMNIFAPMVDKVANDDNVRGLTWLHFGMWFLNYFVFSLVTFFAVLAGARPVQQLVARIPANLMSGLAATGGLLPAVGFAILMRMLWSKQLSPYYFLGFVLAAYLNLPSVAVAAVGIIIVAIQWMRDKQLMDLENRQKQTLAKSDAIIANNNSETTATQEEEDFFS
ncbi:MULTISPECIES: PTS sugar transporter subunit IIC [unclassified Lactobacillus]|uniref:PTS mannose/fructose/sorbose/N-acetylgalactosamine transporter subunit IIC n=1 Tax=unclassified Lactobacillus TaxID=2620435 RepID=UPI000EFCE997|nr:MULTISPECIES: PTS sugar transporter subunit IIC [unclassified Lactobacillus]RMC25785.1 PTS sugar transporter subunit IIC [Lactobacillus sp. ESL0247]RMC29597.1 PTS sugar transporter subunit IIC [Lactobacillus sp. ESL0246]RMC33586.1 PTS sugar transporter subunit IIC [Lactobacillus sp. ESL0245]RMC51596.1 PTS sugar transporter subunit IIC [Lactobacillus sp. ESL0228]